MRPSLATAVPASVTVRTAVAAIAVDIELRLARRSIASQYAGYTPIVLQTPMREAVPTADASAASPLMRTAIAIVSLFASHAALCAVNQPAGLFRPQRFLFGPDCRTFADVPVQVSDDAHEDGVQKEGQRRASPEPPHLLSLTAPGIQEGLQI